MERFIRYFLIYLFLIGIPAIMSAQSSRSLSGKVIDDRNRKGLPNVNVSLKGTNVGTVTNADGNFSLYIPNVTTNSITFSTVGYSTLSLPIDSLKANGNIIRLERQPVELSEVVVYGGDPMKILEAAIEKIPENYSVSKDLLSMFYRETIRKGKRFIGVSEASMSVYKTPYKVRTVDYDRVQLDRGRRLVSQKSSDTLAVKILGGPNLAVNLDFVKNADILFTEHDLTDFIFKKTTSDIL